MTLQELKYLVALADHGHFGRAAEACFITQSTLSTQIKKLEDFLGVTLFDRSLKHVTPTPTGREILAVARNIIEESERIRELARHAQNPMARTLHLGVIPTLGPYYLPHALTPMHKKHPGLRLLLREEMTSQILEHLAWISQTRGCIGAENLRKSLWSNNISQLPGAPRCRQSVRRRCSNLKP